jgi:hypothetical protein
MATVVYVLCILTSALCAVLLARGYRATRVRLLLWSALCFAGLALNNVLLFADIRIFREIDLSIVRTLPALAGILLLLYGLIWETRS